MYIYFKIQNIELLHKEINLLKLKTFMTTFRINSIHEVFNLKREAGARMIIRYLLRLFMYAPTAPFNFSVSQNEPD